MPEKKEDRRVERTRTLLRDALVSLMIEKGYEAITVQDVLDRANVGRSTFYAHFYDKDQLLIATINQLRDYIRGERRRPGQAGRGGAPHFGFSLLMLDHADSHRPLYRAVVGKQSGAAVQGTMQRMLADLARDEIAGLFPAEKLAIPVEVAIDYVMNTFFGLLGWWMEQPKPVPAAEVDGIFHRLVFSGLAGVTKP